MSSHGLDVDGEVVERGAPGYEDRRRAVWNRIVPDRYPDLIVAAASVPDVVAVVDHARTAGLKVAVRTGGHSWVGTSLRDGGVLLDLSRFDGLEVDAGTRRARLGPAVRGAPLAHALAAHGLAFPVGHCGDVPMGGYLLNGGLGLNWGAWKPACFSVRAVEVVTAAGELVVADEDSQPELLWLARGSGPGFPGVVTRFDVDLQPLPAGTTSSTYVFRLEDAATVLPWVVGVAPELPDEVELSTILVGPQLTGMGAMLGLEGRNVIVTATAFSASPEEGARALAPLRSCPHASRAVLSQLDAPTPYEDLAALTGSVLPPDHRTEADAQWSHAATDEIVLALVDHFAQAPSGKSLINTIMPAGSGTGFPRAGAYSMDHRTISLAYSIWDDPADDARNVAWLREAMRIIEPHARGRFLGESDPQVSADRIPSSFTPDAWARVNELRRAYDPLGVFHGFLGPDDHQEDG